MRIFTVTCDGQAAAIVRAASKEEAIGIAVGLADERRYPSFAAAQRQLAAREPSDAEMVDWLQHRVDHLVPGASAAA